MPLSPGIKFGPYEILAPLGAGGMGEVYRAHDTRLNRDVALKILPEDLAKDPSRRARFEQEARAVAALNHPNIVAIYDVGDDYIVTELVDGASLHGAEFRLSKTLEIGVQIAEGLAAAHAAGIVHRDLKPDNIMLTGPASGYPGRVKILDFGLAKQAAVRATQEETMTVVTDPGTVMGTVGYMSPEQVRGADADSRSDIFNFGLILHELLTGKRTFHGDTPVETMAATLKQDAPELPETVPVGVRQIVTHCLEKDPANRFQSAKDLAFALRSLSGSSVSGATPPIQPARRFLRAVVWAGAIVVFAAAIATGYWAALRHLPPAMTTRQLTFRRGTIQGARFTLDGRTVIYAAAWEGGKTELYSVGPDFPESHPLGLDNTGLLAISRTGEMAILESLRFQSMFTFVGALARMPMAGGGPREVLEGVTAADWSPDGAAIAVVREAQGRSRLEFPPGRLLYDTAGWISHPRVSPRGDQIAFLDHPLRFDDRGSVALVDLSGKKRVLSTGWESEQGLAWSPLGTEIWFSATEQGQDLALQAVSLTGRHRVVARVPGSLKLQDIFPDGRVLLTGSSYRMPMFVVSAGKENTRDLTLFNDSAPVDFSPDSKTILFWEGSEAGGSNYAVCLRGVDGSPAARLGEGQPLALSPDGRWALTNLLTSPPQLVLLPTGAGESRALPRGLIATYQAADWLPDGNSLVLAANEMGRGARLYRQNVASGLPQPISGEGVSFHFYSHPVAPDGKSVAARDADGNLRRYPFDGGEPQLLPRIEPNEEVLRWSKDGRSLFVLARGTLPARVFQIEVPGGRRSVWQEIAPADRAGLATIVSVQLAPDAKTYAYSLVRLLDDLYISEGLK
jgi:Tol biopolymer transport system component/predicted Ser/Thr protein kinase